MKTEIIRACGIVFAGLLLGAAVSAAAQETAPAPAAPAGSEPYINRMRREGPVVELSLREAIEQALVNNLDIAIENYSRDVLRSRVSGTRGFYDPNLSFAANTKTSNNPLSVFQTGADNVDSSRFGPVFTQNIRGGGAVSLALGNTRTLTTSTLASINPLFGSTVDFGFTQPLWRGFIQTATERQLKILQLDTRISEAQFRQTVSETIQKVQDQYWALVFAIENYETRRKSRDLAALQLDMNAQRVQSGLLTPLALTSARAEVASRELDMIQAEVQIVNALNGLRRLLSPDSRAPRWSQFLIPIDRPKVRPLDVTLGEALEVALRRRPEMQQARLQLDENAVDRRFYRKETMPSVNLFAGLGSLGRSGLILQQGADGPVYVPENPAYGGYGKSWRQMFGFDYMNWTLGLNVQLPIRNRALTAQLDQAEINRRKLTSQLKNQEQKIVVEVRNSFETIKLQQQSLDAARLARELSDEQVRAASERFQVGFATTFELLRYQRDLADAQVRELRAIIDYQNALTALEKAMDRIASDNDIVIARRK